MDERLPLNLEGGDRRILITGRNQQELDRTVNELTAQGISIFALRADVSIETENKRMAVEAITKFGTIDVLINNAGISMRALFAETDVEVIKEIMNTNFFGAVYATKYCLPEIIRNKGSVIGISSIAGFRGLPGRTGYSASKFALNGFLEALRLELCPQRGTRAYGLPGFYLDENQKKGIDERRQYSGRIAATGKPHDDRRRMCSLYLFGHGEAEAHVNSDHKGKAHSISK